MSPFDAARKLLETSSMHLSMSSRTDLVFQDDSLVPLLVQENYLNHRPAPATDDRTRLKVRSGQALKPPMLLCRQACPVSKTPRMWACCGPGIPGTEVVQQHGADGGLGLTLCSFVACLYGQLAAPPLQSLYPSRCGVQLCLMLHCLPCSSLPRQRT